MEYRKKLGSYDFPDQFLEIELEELEVALYAPPAEREEEPFSNITVSFGKNPYRLMEHKIFKNAILKQLKGKEDMFVEPQFSGFGKYVRNGIPMYQFEIRESNGVVTRQCYLVGEKKHCLFQETTYEEDPVMDQALENAVASFQWGE